MTATDVINKCIYAQHAGNITIFTFAAHNWLWQPSSGSAPYSNTDFLGAGTLYRDALISTVTYTDSTLTGAITQMLADYPNDVAGDNHNNPFARTILEGL
jgi:hypothetical protein